MSADSKRSPRPTRRRERKRCTRQFRGSTPSTAESASTTSSSTRAASARSFATVAPSTGLAGSTCCVTTTSLTSGPPWRARRARPPARRTRPPCTPSPPRARGRRPRAAARAPGRRGCARARRRSRPAAPGSTRSPVSSGQTTSGIPPARAPTTARPRQSASSTTRGVPSEREASSSSHASSSAFTTSGVSSLALPGDLIREVADQPLGDVARAGRRRRAAAVAAGTRGAASRHASAIGVDVLVALEDTDVERDRALGERLRRAARRRRSGRCRS